MKIFIIITLILICNSLNTNTTSELEIGVIQFEEAKGSQIYNQLVRFDTPFAKLPQVAIALVEHTSTTALFAKVKNITQHDFIIQFFSAVTLNATYRYLATTDNEVYINCSNFRATQQAIFKYPQFQSNIQAIAFLVGYHHNGFVNISINQNSNTQAYLSINTNDVQQMAVGVCLIVGSNLQFDDVTNTPKFSGRISSQGQTRSLSFKPSIFKILFIEVQQNSGQSKQEIEESLTDLKTFFDQNQNKIDLDTEQNTEVSKELEPQTLEDLEEFQQELNDDNIVEDQISDDVSEEEDEDDEYFWDQKNKQSKSSVDFELQLTLLQDALKKKPQIQQQAVKEIIKTNQSNKKEQKQKQVIKKQKDEVQNQNKSEEDQNLKKNDNIKNVDTQILNNEEIDMQLQQKESHVKSLKKALQLVDTAKEKELEVILPKIENKKQLLQEQESFELNVDNKEQDILQVSKPIGYQSPLIDDIPKMEDILEVKQKEKKFTQKLDGYMQSFSQDTYTQKVQKKKQEEQISKSESNEKQTMEQVQLIQLTGQSHSTKVVYEASEDSLRKFEEDFERRKQEKMKEIKQQLIPENKPTKVKFLSLAQEDEQLRSYKDFFYN